MGAAIAGKPGYAYSDALKSKGGTWTWEAMSEWLKSPKSFANGTKMTFAGLGDPQERANLMAWLNSQGSSLALPAAPAPDAAAATPGAGTGDGAQKAEKEPVTNATGAADPKGGGEADPEQH